MQLLLLSLAVLQIYSWPRGGANAGPVEKDAEACPGGNCDSSYSFNNDDVLIRKQRYAMSGRGGPDGGQTDSDREDDSDGVQIETLEWDEGDHDGPHFHGQSDIYKSVLLQTDPEDGQPVQKPPLAGDDEPADEKPAKDLDKFKARSAPTTEDKAALEDSTTDEDRDNDDKEKTLMFEDSEDKESSQNKDVEPKKKTGKRDHDDFSGLHFHRMSSLYKTVMTKGELEEEEEEVNGSEVKDQSNGEGQDDDLDVEDSKNGDEKDKDEENGPEDAEGPTDITADENKDSVDKNKDDENGPEETEGPSETTADEDRDSVDEKLIDSSEDKESFQSKDVEPKKKRRKRDTRKRDHDDFSGLHFHRMSSLYKTVMTKGELEEEEEEVKGSELKGQSKDEGPDDEVEKESTTTDENNNEPEPDECTDENCSGCPSCQNEKPETSEDEAEEASEDEDNVEDEGGAKGSEEDGGGAMSSEEDGGGDKSGEEEGGGATNSAEEQLNGEENQNKEDEHETEPVEDDSPINVKDYISRVLLKYRDERLVHTHTDDP
ncbi:Hypp7481 [Branchiostoma lanceolatum]|uniref:Hypp7481 protein n=1 Tax=Branchiostoma lanceolatum TaxID=7740 RepID=A0A8K0EED6_BRALA|nr:Hypp7481 [Branchiostoma lanceolatum]